MSPRWKKIIRELWDHKGRTIMVLLIISVGVFAAGFVSGLFFVTLPDMDADYQAANPRSAWIFTDPFEEDLLPVLQRVPGVGQVEGRSVINAKVFMADGSRKLSMVFAIQPLDKIKLDRIEPVVLGEEIPPLGKQDAWVEQSAMQALGLKPGDMLRLELLDGQERQLRLVSYVHSVTSFPYPFIQQVTVFVSPETIVWLGGDFNYNQVVLRVAEDHMNEAHIREVAKGVSEKIEDSGRAVYSVFVLFPGRHFATDTTRALGMIMGILGILVVAMSSFLVLSTVNAIVNQQVQQIGVMKAIGAQTGQLVAMYLLMVVCFGLLGLFFGSVLVEIAGSGAGSSISSYLNFRPGPPRTPIQGTIIQFFVAIIIPLFAAVLPVIKGTRITVREALSSYGLSSETYGNNLVDRIVERIRGLPRPLLISLRNTFRRKARLALTLSALVIAGAIFISVFNLRASMAVAIDETFGYVLSDVNIAFSQPYQLQKVYPIAMSIPGVVEAEAWGSAAGGVLTEDGLTSTQVSILAPPAKSTFIEPTLSSGRWLEPGDENALVIGNHMTARRPELGVGDVVTIDIDGQKSTWKIVGVYRMAGNTATPILYANNEYLSRLLHNLNRASTLRIRTQKHDLLSQKQTGSALEAAYKRAGIQVATVELGAEQIALSRSSTDILVIFLMMMALLIAIVGGLGLMSAMSLNVLERTREIGVIRAIGATNGAVLQLVIVEGMIIGIISWLIGAVFSIPIGVVLADAVGRSMLQSPLEYVFSMDGFLIWLLLVIVLSSIASFIPARSASRMTVRETLAYE